MNYAAILKSAFDMYFNASIEAFFTDKLFPAEYINDLQIWNKIFFPFQSGIGILQPERKYVHRRHRQLGSAPGFIF